MATEPVAPASAPAQVAADPKASAASQGAAPPVVQSGAVLPGVQVSTSGAQAATPTTQAPASPASAAAPAAPAPDVVPELVRVAQAERRAAKAVKDAEAKGKALDAVAAKEKTFNDLVAKGSLLDAVKVYFPNDDVLADKLFWELNDYVRKLPAPAEPTVEERAAKAAREALEAERKTAEEKATAAKKEAETKADTQLREARDAYYAQARKALAANPAAFPNVTAKLLSGDLTQDEITGHVEAIGEAVLARGLSEADLRAALKAETSPEAVFAALEQVIKAETAPAVAAPASLPVAEPGAAPLTLSQITEAAIAQAMGRARPATISSSAIVGAAPVAPKDPREMSLEELNTWAIAEAERRGARAAG